MTETVLVLPLIFVVLALLFFFGLAMTRWQRSSVTDRYEAWRQAQYAPGPGVSFEKQSHRFGSADLLNETFFADNADSLDATDRGGRIRVQEPTDLIAEEAYYIAQAYPAEGFDPAKAEDYVRELHARLPAWWRIALSTEHISDIPLYQQFAGPVKHQHTVIDGDWTFAFWLEQENRGVRSEIDPILTDHVYLNQNPRDTDGYVDLYNYRPYSISGVYYVFYEDIEQPIEALADQDNELAGAIRGIYMNLPDYVGPEVLPEVIPHALRLDTSSDTDPGRDP